MNTSELANDATFLDNFIAQFNRYVPIPLLGLGLIGNILTLLVLCRPALRSNSCSMYFISASITNIISIFDGLIPRILFSFAQDLSETADLFCKIKHYFIFSSSTLSSWFIVLATIDRYLSSSRNAQTRQWSSIQRTRWLISGITIFILIFFIDKLICFVADIPNEAIKCNARQGACRIYHDYSYVMIYSFAPSLLVIIFGVLILINVRKLGRNNIRIHPEFQIAARSQARRRARDLQLISMLIVQIIFLVICTFPISIIRIYMALTESIVKSSLRRTHEIFAIQFIIMLTFIPNINTFYIYIITGKVFRKEFRVIIKCWLRKIGMENITIER